MPKHRTILCSASLAMLSSPASADPASKEARAARGEMRTGAVVSKQPKYYFKVVQVNVGKNGDSDVAKVARELLEKELQSRPEFTSDIGEARDPAAELAELKKRGLRGFEVSLRLDKLAKDLKAPKPGGRLKQLAVDVKVSVFGTTF